MHTIEQAPYHSPTRPHTDLEHTPPTTHRQALNINVLFKPDMNINIIFKTEQNIHNPFKTQVNINILFKTDMNINVIFTFQH